MCKFHNRRVAVSFLISLSVDYVCTPVYHSVECFEVSMKLRKSSFAAIISTVLLTDGEGVVPPVALAQKRLQIIRCSANYH